MADLWYYTHDGKQMDPVPIKELQRLAAEGTVKPVDMVWREGMPRWVRAGSLGELFPVVTRQVEPIMPVPHAAASVPVAASEIAPPAAARPVPPPAPPQEPGKPYARRRRSAADDASDESRPARRPSSNGANSNLGIIIAIVFGAGILFAGLAIGIFILVTAPSDHPAPKTDSRPAVAVKGTATENASIAASSTYSCTFKLRKRVEYEITLRNNPQETVVSLSVYDRNGEQQKINEDTNKFFPDHDDDYRFEIKNSDQKTRVTSVLTIRETAAPNDDKDLPPGVKKGKDVIPDVNLTPGKDYVCKLRVKAGYGASVAVKNHTKNRPDVDFNIYILRDSDGGEIAADTRADADARVEFRRDADEIVRVRVHNASKTAPARCTILLDGGP